MSIRMLIKAVGYLASDRYQRKYIAQATKDEYVVPEELLVSTCGAIESYFRNPILLRQYSIQQLAALRHFYDIVKYTYSQISFDNEAWDSIVENNKEWSQMRAAAKEFMVILGGNLMQWEEVNVPGGGH